MKFIVNESKEVITLIMEKLKLPSKSKARNLIKAGGIFLDRNEIRRGDEIAQKGQEIQIKKPEKKPYLPPTPPFDLLFQDEDVVVAVKPAGLLSVNRDNENSKTFHKIVNQYIREISKKKERVFLVHRLDREVSGIMIFAKSLDIQQDLEEGWRGNEKKYLALVEGKPLKQEGKCESLLAENAALKVYSTKSPENAKLAITHYKVRETFEKFSLVEVRLETGRKHQIRVHMSDLGCPIVGDKKYGSHTPFIGRIALHSYFFSFHHPRSGEKMVFETPMPTEFERFIKG